MVRCYYAKGTERNERQVKNKFHSVLSALNAYRERSRRLVLVFLLKFKRMCVWITYEQQQTHRNAIPSHASKVLHNPDLFTFSMRNGQCVYNLLCVCLSMPAGDVSRVLLLTDVFSAPIPLCFCFDLSSWVRWFSGGFCFCVFFFVFIFVSLS